MKPGNSITAHNIRFLRKRIPLSQQEMADKYSIGPGGQRSISNWERGAFKPDYDFLVKLAKDTGIDIEILKTVKLKTDTTGKIINLPSIEQEIQDLRNEVYKKMNALRIPIEAHFKWLQSVIARIDAIEKKRKK